MKIKNKLIELDGVNEVEGDPVSKIVTVVWQAPNTLDKINSKLKFRTPEMVQAPLNSRLKHPNNAENLR